jgi:hypothetical protein
MLDRLLWAALNFGGILLMMVIFSLPIVFGLWYERRQVAKLTKASRYTHKAHDSIMNRVQAIIIGGIALLIFAGLFITAPV